MFVHILRYTFCEIVFFRIFAVRNKCNVMDNPFIFRVYKSKELFCDREKELKTLLTNCTSGADTTLIAHSVVSERPD